VGVGAVARDLRRPQCGPPRGRQPHLSLSTYKIGAREEERGSWEVVEKEREKDLGKVVTGGGEGTEAEGTEKANHRGHGHGENKPRRTRRRQTTEGTENTEIGKEEADRQGGGLRWSAQACGLDGIRKPRTCRRVCGSAGVTAGMASLAACSTWGRRVEVERGGVRAGWHSETPYVWRVCGSAGVTAGMASLAACSTEKSAWQA
jgi:hypothetical protein